MRRGRSWGSSWKISLTEVHYRSTTGENGKRLRQRSPTLSQPWRPMEDSER